MESLPGTNTLAIGMSYLSEHVEKEPVSHLALLDDGVDHFPFYQPETDVEKVRSHSRTQDDDGAIKNDQSG
jgi:hypothetical protein